MRLYADALRPAQNAQALPNALARAQAQEVIARASFCAPEFVDVEPALGGAGQVTPMAFGRDNTTPPPPVPARSEATKGDTGNPVSKNAQSAEPVPRTGLNSRPIITLKKIRRVIK
jgi:hypothetical protein